MSWDKVMKQQQERALEERLQPLIKELAGEMWARDQSKPVDEYRGQYVTVREHWEEMAGHAVLSLAKLDRLKGEGSRG